MRAARLGELAQMAPTDLGWLTSSRRNSERGERVTARCMRTTLARAVRTAATGSAAKARARATISSG